MANSDLPQPPEGNFSGPGPGAAAPPPTPAAHTRLWRFLRGYGITLLLLGAIGYQLWNTWIPLWIRSGDLQGLDLSAHHVTDPQGRSIPLSTYRGRPLVLNFWATWCLPCRVEIPQLAALYPGLREDGVELLGVNVKEQWEVIAAFRKEHDMPFPVVRDDGPLVNTLNIKIIPALVVLNEQGRVENIVYGFRPWVALYLKWWL